MCVERKHVRNVLVGTHDNDRATLPSDGAGIENVRAVPEIRCLRLLVVDESETPLSGKQRRWQSLDRDVAVAALKHRASARRLSASTSPKSTYSRTR